MVAPAAAQVEVARRVALAMEAEALYERNRGDVPGLDIGLEPMQAELPKSVPEHEAEAFAHVALAGEWRADVIAEVGALKGAARDLTEFDGAEEGLIQATTEEKPDKVGASTPREVVRELGGRSGWRDPGVMDDATLPVQREELPLVPCGGETRGAREARAAQGRGACIRDISTNKGAP
jgi:hypothetical protein